MGATRTINCIFWAYYVFPKAVGEVFHKSTDNGDVCEFSFVQDDVQISFTRKHVTETVFWERAYLPKRVLFNGRTYDFFHAGHFVNASDLRHGCMLTFRESDTVTDSRILYETHFSPA